MDFLGDADGKGFTFSAGHPGSIPRSEELLEKGMAAHSSILAWRIPWIEETSGLQFMGSQSWTELNDKH